jgi:Fe-S cluster assembly protein SufD
MGTPQQFSNTVSQFNLQAGSQVAMTRVQDRQPTHLHTGRVAARVGADASFKITSIDIGGALIRNDIAIDLAEAGAHVTMNGLYLASDNQHIDNHTRVDHRVGPSTSIEEYRGLLNGKARCIFNGKAIVHPGADGSDAQQSNHNLLMSDQAEIDTKPELEIYADEVKCSHGATVGQLDPVSLFYLRSRGLDKDEATRVLISAFATKIIEDSPLPEAHDYLQQRSKECLEGIIAGDAA